MCVCCQAATGVQFLMHPIGGSSALHGFVCMTHRVLYHLLHTNTLSLKRPDLFLFLFNYFLFCPRRSIYSTRDKVNGQRTS